MYDNNIVVDDLDVDFITGDVGENVVGGVDSPTSVGEVTPTTIYDIDDMYYVTYYNSILLSTIMLYLFITGVFGKGWRH